MSEYKPLRTSSITQFLTKNNYLASHDPEKKVYLCNEDLSNAVIKVNDKFITVTVEKPLPISMKDIGGIFFAINKGNEGNNKIIYDVKKHSIKVSIQHDICQRDCSVFVSLVQVTTVVANTLANEQLPRYYNSDAFQEFSQQTMLNATRTEEALPNKPSLIM